ncbi:MAG: hypothetical protein COU33_02290 [Candidatus Magasanikbacteria bacterium CG10_big_fil_rev_8_21_14_0_10_43_6]|uniref:Bacterial Pleckstrin homology domain-containing protein n=1 Tax=Candidatus Magasanikbacteria bacterium CG10_big_fil_rev_8_21_14_0_10_43_6 TaxID=1974650 RepID=A0A2M6W1B3_9BACT|nr:MAG: hypothetical protein COU33_02290 [Candidatus Magasanikbacteria bacterium CG10_big_fil_rev_8_21_14_0_10_43_6]
MIYTHTQKSYAIIGIMVALCVIFGMTFFTQDAPPLAVTPVLILIVVLLGSFTSLTVTVDQTYLKVKFGYGIFSKKFLRTDIASATHVKHTWYHGWGIRYWIPKRMWIYTISGFDLIEITLTNGRVYRIGTDEPQQLLAALKET